MPQLDISAWPPQLFWLAITFGALFFVVSRLIIPKIGGTIERRKSTVESDLAMAARHRTDTDAVIKAYEAVLEDARNKANTTSAAARGDLNGEIQAMTSKVGAELAAKVAQADKAIAAGKAKAVTGIEQAAAEISAAIVSHLTGAAVSESEATATVRSLAKQG